MPTLISAAQAADILGLNYHAFLYWIKNNKNGVGDHAQKIGHGWAIDESFVQKLKADLDAK